MNVTVADWAALLAIVVALFALDLLLATLRPHAVGFREAALWSVFFMAAAVGFGVILARLEGWGTGLSSSRATSWRRACPSTTCSSS